MHSQKVDFAQSRSQNTFCGFAKICLEFPFGQQPVNFKVLELKAVEIIS
jgi:hypothetical protein